MSLKQIIDIPCPPFDIKLSHWDIRFPPAYSRRLLCFELNLSSSLTQETVVSHVLGAFQATVAELPYLAGTIVPRQGGASWLHDIQAQGSAKLIVRDVSAELPSYIDLKSRGMLGLEHGLLCPFNRIVSREAKLMDVCRVQANFLSGGLILTFSVNNIVSDGVGITETIRTFAEKLRNFKSLQPGESSPSRYSIDRAAILNGGSAYGDVEHHSAWCTAAKPAYSDPNALVTTRHSYQISASDLSLLKQNMSSSLPSGTWISTHDSIMALLWRSLIAARQNANHFSDTDDTHTSITTAVDCRSRMGLPTPYHGNAIYAINPSLPRNTLLDDKTGLTTAALSIRAAIQAAEKSKFQDLLAFTQRSEKDTPTTLSVLPHLEKGGIFLTSHFGFDMCGMDFGPELGKVERYWQPTSSVMPGTPHILPRLLDGSCVVMFNESEDVMKCLGENEVWTRYAVALS